MLGHGASNVPSCLKGPRSQSPTPDGPEVGTCHALRTASASWVLGPPSSVSCPGQTVCSWSGERVLSPFLGQGKPRPMQEPRGQDRGRRPMVGVTPIPNTHRAGGGGAEAIGNPDASLSRAAGTRGWPSSYQGRDWPAYRVH